MAFELVGYELNELIGKTVAGAKAHSEKGVFYITFSDGTACRVDRDGAEDIMVTIGVEKVEFVAKTQY